MPQTLNLNFGSLEMMDKRAANVAIADKSYDLFFDPDNFPITLDGSTYNMSVRYSSEEQLMLVDVNGSALSNSVVLPLKDMTNYQKTVTLLYAIGRLRDERD